ncbi:MAG: ATP synthase subunit I [Alcanivoracaceae bacterium]|nr:ATP synthase subunit I [Alcanivoracaceae bacterium]
MTGTNSQGPKQLFWGLLRAQAVATFIIAIGMAVFGSSEQILIALWGGSISVIAYAWAGYQLWMHPKNRLAQRHASAAVRAEVGKIVILLLLFWLTLKEWPATRDSNALILFAAFFFAQLVGWIWLAQRLASDPQSEAQPQSNAATSQPSERSDTE